jgi:hypothetical protein
MFMQILRNEKIVTLLLCMFMQINTLVDFIFKLTDFLVLDLDMVVDFTYNRLFCTPLDFTTNS